METIKRFSVLVFSSAFLFGVMVLPGLLASGPAYAETWNLKFWTEQNDSSPDGRAFQKLFADIEQKTSGRVKVTPYWSGSLVPMNQAFESLKVGLADFAYFNGSINPEALPVTCVPGLPFLMVNGRAPLEFLRAVYKAGLAPEISNQGFHTLGPKCGAPGLHLITTKKKITKLEDLHGLKLRTPSKEITDFLSACGGTPVNIPIPETYMALERGVVDGFIAVHFIIIPLKFIEICKYFLDVPVGNGAGILVMNQKVWDSLPDDIQSIMTGCTETYADDFFETTTNDKAKFYIDVKAKGMEVYDMPPAELKKMQEAGKTVVADYIESLNKKGLQGQRIIDLAREIDTSLNKQ